MPIDLKTVGRGLRIEIRRGGAIVDLDVGRQQTLAILVREQQDRLGDVPDRPLGQTRLIVFDQRDDIPAGNVAMIDDGEAGGVEVAPDAGNRTAMESSNGSSARAADSET